MVSLSEERISMNKWEMYDRLIEAIPEDIVVEDYCVGCAWTIVKAGGYNGVALTVRQRAGSPHNDVKIIGEPLKKVAELVKSWYFLEASIGLAAINAYYNNSKRVGEMSLLEEGADGDDKGDAFKVFGEAVAGKKVAVIGHFPYIEKRLKPICDLSILERDPQRGDCPDSSCEYILPEQDYVFITGMTLTNKTLPRLLELCSNAKVCVVGPSAPLSKILGDYGVYCVSGFCATDSEVIAESIRRGVKQEIFKGGQMVNLFMV